MKTLLEETNLFKAIIGTQKVDHTKEYIRSLFTLVKETDDGVLAYNTFTGALFLLSGKEYTALKTGKPDDDTADLLVKHWLLVPEADNNVVLFQQFKKLVIPLFNKGVYKTYTIMTTTDCNARCYYCYQSNLEKKTMSLMTAKAVADFIKRTSGEETVHIRWFGGEPLYNSKVIDEICEELTKSGIKFQSSMITNAILFDDEHIQRATDIWHLKKVQVTLDGTRDVYNATKAYIYTNIADHYSTVISNIENISRKKIHIKIRLNIGLENVNDLLLLARDLSEKFSGNKYVSVYTAILYDLQKDICNSTDNLSEFKDKVIELNNRIYDNGLIKEKLTQNSFIINNCMADDDSAVVMSPTGELCKCEHFSKEEVIGDVFSGVLDTDRINTWRQEMILPECNKCAFLPICNHLQKCENCRNGCSPFTRQLMQLEYEEYMINTAKNAQ